MNNFRNTQQALFKSIALLAVAGLILSACGPASVNGLGGAVGGILGGGSEFTRLDNEYGFPEEISNVEIIYAGMTFTLTPTSTPTDDNKVTVCHATSSETSPNVVITITLDAAFNDQGEGGHFHEDGSPLSGHEQDFVVGAAPAEYPNVPTGTQEDCIGAAPTPTQLGTSLATNTPGGPTATPTSMPNGTPGTPLATNTPGGPTATPTVTPTGTLSTPTASLTGTLGTPTASPTNFPTPLPAPPFINIGRDIPPAPQCVQFIIFHTFRDGNLELYRLDGVEGNSDAVLYNLSQGPGSEDSRPSRSWDDKLIAFESNRDGNVELYLTDVVGSFQDRITFSTSNNINPMFMPDNQTVLFQSDRNGNWDIFSINILTGEERQLTTSSANDVFPYASPSDEWMTFQSDRSGNGDVYLLNLLTGNEYQVTRDNTNQFYPTWSPNGKYLAFLSEEEGNTDLIVMDVNDNERINITLGADRDANNPSWSPEGNRIAYQSWRNDKLDVYSFDLTTLTEYKVSNAQTNESSPSWDCGGGQISFTSLRDGDPNIYAAPWTGGGNGYLTNSPATDKWSHWSPAKETGSRGR